MGTVTLSYLPDYDGISVDIRENQIRDQIITSDHHIMPSIYFSAPESNVIPESMLVLNRKKHVDRAMNSAIQKQLLQLHGVPISENGKCIREYILYIFQTHTLVMYGSTTNAWLTSNKKKTATSFQRVSLQKKGKEIKRVQNLAIRALYALGLDYGAVKCGIGIGKKTMILHVDPSPKLNDEMESVYIQSILDYMKDLRDPKVELDKIVLGADPEFVMQSPKGHLLIASNYFPVNGRVGCDAIWLGQNHSNKPLVEIRPGPTADPRELAIGVYQGLQYAAKKMSGTTSRWLAGALPHKGFPLGGHIHFSGIHPNFKMLRCLDNYVALMLMMAEDRKGISRRPKYGFLGDFRYQPHGGFEYRTLPSWLVSPTLTKGVFALSKIVVANYDVLKYDLLADVEFQKAYYQGNKEIINDWVHILWEDLKSLGEYSVYKSYIDRFFQYIVSGTTWDETKDFRKNWRIAPYHREDTQD